MSRRFLVTLLTIGIIAIGAALSIFYAKGYRVSPQTGKISGTGILSITSVPEQASVYLDDHLTTATNTNINSLTPKDYNVRIEKEGYTSWNKKVEVKESLVTKIKATLFKSIPSISPSTYTGVENVILSPDEQKLVYVVPRIDGAGTFENRKSGVWVIEMSARPLAFARINQEPFQIAQSDPTLDYSKAKFRWSPDSSQVLVTLPDRYLLLDSTKLNNPPRDVTATYQATLRLWDEEQKSRNQVRLQTIVDPNFVNIASSSATVKWSPDETKILYSADGKSNYKVLDFFERKTYDIPQAYSYSWLADSEHLVLTSIDKPEDLGKEKFVAGKISIVEYDGFNQSMVYAGQFVPDGVFVWPDDSKLLIVSNYPTTVSKANLFNVNIK